MNTSEVRNKEHDDQDFVQLFREVNYVDSFLKKTNIIHSSFFCSKLA